MTQTQMQPFSFVEISQSQEKPSLLQTRALFRRAQQAHKNSQDICREETKSQHNLRYLQSSPLYNAYKILYKKPPRHPTPLPPHRQLIPHLCLRHAHPLTRTQVLRALRLLRFRGGVLRLDARNGPFRLQQSKLLIVSMWRGGGGGGGEGTIDSSRHTGSVGWAPTPSQYFAREVSSWMSFVGLPMPSAGGLGIGS